MEKQVHPVLPSDAQGLAHGSDLSVRGMRQGGSPISRVYQGSWLPLALCMHSQVLTSQWETQRCYRMRCLARRATKGWGVWI